MYHVCHVSRICVCHTTILSFFGCAIVCGHPFSVLFLFAVVAVIVTAHLFMHAIAFVLALAPSWVEPAAMSMAGVGVGLFCYRVRIAHVSQEDFSVCLLRVCLSLQCLSLRLGSQSQSIVACTVDFSLQSNSMKRATLDCQTEG